MNVDLSSAESEVLADVLKQWLGEMREQIYHAEAPKFKNELKQRRGVVEGVLDKLSTAAAKSPAMLH